MPFDLVRCRPAPKVMALASVRFTIRGWRSGAELGDTIHIAAGCYYGRLDRCRRSSRHRRSRCSALLARLHDANAVEDPVCSRRLTRRYARENNLIGGRGTHDDLVLDGLC